MVRAQDIMLTGSAVSKLLLRCQAPVTILRPTAKRPLFIGFTGTSTMADVYDDVRFFARPWPPEEEDSEALVHGGFADRTMRLCGEDMLGLLQSNPRAIIAGHSMGGACAVLVAFWAARLCPHPLHHTVHTMGAPRLGNAAFCEAYRRQGMWDRTWRHRTPHDPVVKIPPWLRHVGNEVVVPSDARPFLAQHRLCEYQWSRENTTNSEARERSDCDLAAT